MTVYHRLKVWAIKGYRFVKFGFRTTRARTHNIIFNLLTNNKCDYCTDFPHGPCIVLECDYEVYANICKSCLTSALSIFGATPNFLPIKNDHRGVIT